MTEALSSLKAYPIFAKPLTKEKIQKQSSEMISIYTSKTGKTPIFEPVAAKEKGSSLGTIFKRVHTDVHSYKPHTKWMGKVGRSRGVFIDDERTYRTLTKHEMNFDTILEKIAYDLYQELGRTLSTPFRVPRTCLSNQPILDRFTLHHPYALCLAGGPEDYRKTFYPSHEAPQEDKRLTNDSLRIMSRFVSHYKDFACAQTKNKEGRVFSFMQFLKTYHYPPEELLTPNGQLVPLYGLIELLAIGRILADTDSLGGGNNAGFVWKKDESGTIYAAEAVKIDPGLSFQFENKEDNNWALNTHTGLGGRILDNIKDIQIANLNPSGTIIWTALSSKQRQDYLLTLIHCKRYIEKEDLLDFLFFRDGFFNKCTVENIPKEKAEEFQRQLKKWFELQLEIYAEDLNQLKNQMINEFNALIDKLIAVQDVEPHLIATVHSFAGFLVAHQAAPTEYKIYYQALCRYPFMAPLKEAYLETLVKLQATSLSELIIELLTLPKDAKGNGLLHQFAQGPIKVLNCLLQQKCLVNEKNQRGLTPLHLAAQAGAIENINALILRGADIEARDLEGKTPLHLAASLGKEQAVQLLLERGANPNHLSSEKETALHLAASQGFLGTVGKLLQHSDLQLFLEAKDVQEETALHKATKGNSSKPAIVQLLTQRGANINARNSFGYTSLHWAAKWGHLESLKTLIAHGGDLKALGEYGRTLLHMSVFNHRMEVTRFLLEQGIDINVQTTAEDSLKIALHDAVIHGDIEMVELLTKEPLLNVMHPDVKGHSPLWHAVSDDLEPIVTLLIKHRSFQNPPNVKNPNHLSQLIELARFRKFSKTFKVLKLFEIEQKVQDYEKEERRKQNIESRLTEKRKTFLKSQLSSGLIEQELLRKRDELEKQIEKNTNDYREKLISKLYQDSLIR